MPRGRYRRDEQLGNSGARPRATSAARTINQARALILIGPDDLRARFAGHTAAALVSGLASLRLRPGDVPGYATRSRCGS